MRRYFRDQMLEADDIDDFDLIDDFDDDDADLDDEFDDEFDEEDIVDDIEEYDGEDERFEILSTVAENLNVDYDIVAGTYFRFYVSTSVTVEVELQDPDEKPVYTVTSDETEFDCTKATTDISDLCDALTLAIMVVKEAKEKLRGV